MAPRRTVRATAAFVAFVDGRMVAVAEGELLSASDPVVKANPGLFEVPVEQATAAPGEKRKR